MGYAGAAIGLPAQQDREYFHCNPATVNTLIGRLAERMGKDNAGNERERLMKIVESLS